MGDIVDGLLRAGAMESAIGQEFNLASGVETRIIDLVETINDLTGNSAGHYFIVRRKWDTKPRLLASIERAKSLIGYEPRTEFKDVIRNTVEWFKEKWIEIESSASFGPRVPSAVREVAVE